MSKDRNKSENLVATLFAVYAIILVLCIAIYAIFKLLKVDITLATNLLLWSAAIFAPVAVLMTYNSWREQKGSEVVAILAKDITTDILELRALNNEIFSGVCVSNISFEKSQKNVNEFHDLRIQIKKSIILLNEYLKNENLYKITKIFNQQAQERNVEYWDILHKNSNKYARETVKKSQIGFDPILEQLINYTLYK